MKPYYQDESVTIYHGDCRDIMPELPKVDLVLTDPPYGLNTKMNGGSWGNTASNPDEFHWDYLVEQKLIDEIISYADVSIIWGGNYYKLPLSRCWLGWNKSQKMYSVSDFELAWTNMDKPSKLWEESRNSDGERQHPTQKPLSLMKWCILQVKDEPNIILDPFMGSGSTLRAAKNLNRQAIGIEIEEKYCEIAVRRLSQEVLPFNFGWEQEENKT